MHQKINFDKPLLKIFAGYYKPHWKLFAADMFCAALISGTDLAFPMMTKFTIEKLLPTGRYQFFFFLISLMVALYLLRMGFTYFVTYWGHTVGAYIEADMRRDLFNHLQELPFSFYDNNRTGQIMSRVTTDLFEVTELAHHGPEDLFISFLTLIGSFILVFTIRWEMAAVLLVMVPLMIVITIVSRGTMRLASRKVKERTAEINASLESSISGARVAKAFTNESYETGKFKGGNENFKNAKKNYYKTMAGFHSKVEFMTNLLTVTVIAAGGFLIMGDKMTLAELITCNLFVAAFLQPIRRLQNFVEQFTTGMAGFGRFAEIMRIMPDIQDRPNAFTLDQVKGNIGYEDVTFAYTQDAAASERYVLRNINLNVPAGTTLALVGPSGGGKTTLCHLLPRFYETSKGSITIDGHDIRDVTLESLRRNIGIVQQEVFLFAGTIKENIAYGRINATDEEIMEAAKQSEIHDDIMEMPQGYDTLVGERGIKLSGGQKQRVSIARIFLKNPPILILDEATSALDSATELKIQKALEELSRGRTTMVIAHRLSTIRNAGRIVVIDDEGIRQQGTHSELLESGGLYAELHAAQFNASTHQPGEA
ncbi:ABC transporter ATP-binding protein [Leadbettera azotonutricia]|uniref:Lipid A export ATP-binding/permease protein MsbA n=1 Tax=Leadbettera azotonutricia (strain ATCC BAA-888 / DSM 13862 / ZAS-9) TaxID=545695 RepID=F5YBP9_LEAAZ|nr:ABC transporter ATP-binding protein [Leadbettera azotonutricia]AEF80370.1 lipid A export ATP-binding/permease protein MsbA [Leadbettera azotonutricia ZAS-9]